MEIAGLTLFGLVVAVLISLFIQASFLMWGAKLAGISGRTYGRAFGTIILAGVASSLLAWPLSTIPLFGWLGGFVGGFFITALILMALFDTSFGKALGATVIAWVLGILVLGALAVVFMMLAGSLAAFA